jgi:hypothetical protein
VSWLSRVMGMAVAAVPGVLCDGFVGLAARRSLDDSTAELRDATMIAG